MLQLEDENDFLEELHGHPDHDGAPNQDDRPPSQSQDTPLDTHDEPLDQERLICQEESVASNNPREINPASKNKLKLRRSASDQQKPSDREYVLKKSIIQTQG